MIPLLPILIALRVVQAVASRGKPQAAPRATEAGLYWVVWLAAGLVCGLSAAAFEGEGFWWAFLALYPVLAPWPIVRLVLIPLGLPRAAALLARLAFFVLGNDTRSGAAFAGALALARSRDHDERLAEVLERRVTREAPRPVPISVRDPEFASRLVDGHACAALGLLEVSRGAPERARPLLWAALDFPGRPSAQRVCLAWVAAEAFDRRDDAALERLAALNPSRWWRLLVLLRRSAQVLAHAVRLRKEPPEPLPVWQSAVGLPPSARLLVALARRRAPQARVPAPWQQALLLWRFVRALRPSLWPLVREALRAPPAPTFDFEDYAALPEPEDGLLAWAVSLHARLLGTAPEAREGRSLAALAWAWDTTLAAPETGRLLAERELALGVREAEDAVARLTAAVTGDLAAAARESGVALPEGGPQLLEDAAWQQRSELLDALRESAQALHRRVDEGRLLPYDAELREWAAVRARYDAALLLGEDVRRLAFREALVPVTHHGAWLFNSCGAKALAHAEFRWLLHEAEAVEDAPSVEMLRRNVSISVT